MKNIFVIILLIILILFYLIGNGCAYTVNQDKHTTLIVEAPKEILLPFLWSYDYDDKKVISMGALDKIAQKKRSPAVG